MTASTGELRAAIERRRGRAFTAAEANIDIAGLQAVLEEGKQALAAEITKAQRATVRKWVMNGARGHIEVKDTPRMRRIVEGLYDAGHRHGRAELRKCGYRQYADQGSTENRDDARRALAVATLMTLLQARLDLLLNAKIRARAAEVYTAELTRLKLISALNGVRGAIDVASRTVSMATYRGLGSAFAEAAHVVDKAPATATADTAAGGTGEGTSTGGGGWQYTAVLDGGTCDPCEELDGTEYDTYAEAAVDLPYGGPNPDCLGDGRCRCRLVPAPA